MSQPSARSPRPTLRGLLLLSSFALVTTACTPPESLSDEVPFVLPGSLVANAEYAARRARLMDEFPKGATLVPGATSSVHEGPLRQNNDFFYFTGVEAPNASG